MGIFSFLCLLLSAVSLVEAGSDADIPLTRANLDTGPQTPINDERKYRVLSSSGTPSSQGQTWCVAKQNADMGKLQLGLKFACGDGGADCVPIQPGSTCYNPNSLEAHASYAFNSYYQKMAHAPGSCDFGGVAYIVDQPPQYGACEFPTTSDSGTSPDSGPPPSQGQRWCVAKKNAEAERLQAGLDFACGQGGVDCGPIQPSSTCNSLEARASYAFNRYYQKEAHASGSCDFAGAAYIVDQPPQYGECEFLAPPNSGKPPGPPSSGTPPSSGKPPGPPSSGTPPSSGKPPGPPSSGTPPSSGKPPDPPSGGTPPSSGKPPGGGTLPDGSATPPAQEKKWCVANGNAGYEMLVAWLKYGCLRGWADCGQLQPGGTCYMDDSNSLMASVTYLFNGYYQKKARAIGSCEFGGAAYVVTQPPQYGTCEFTTETPPSSGTPPASGTPPSPGQTWCVAKGDADPEVLKSGLEYACGMGGADCGPIQPGSSCYNPNTLEAHASYAFNSFYQRKNRAAGSCDFASAAQIVNQPPQYGQCKFPTGFDSGPLPTNGTQSPNRKTWCVANKNAGVEILEAWIKYACEQPWADCGLIQEGSDCYDNNSTLTRASYLVNAYYQSMYRDPSTCNLGGVAYVVFQPPRFAEYCELSSGTPATKGQTWCVAKQNVEEEKLQDGMKYACGEGQADCGPIQPGGMCYNPNTLEAHASYAFNSFYQKKGRADGTCDFEGAAHIVDQSPQYNQCDFPTK